MLQRAEQAARPLAEMLEHITIRPLAAPLNALQPGNRYVQRSGRQPASLPRRQERSDQNLSMRGQRPLPSCYFMVEFNSAAQVGLVARRPSYR
jgi:hypothetical protein